MFFEKEDANIYYTVEGQGEPLVMVHGAAMDAELYAGAAELLAKHYQVIRYDRKGSSRSAGEKDADYTINGQVQDLKALLDELKVEKVILVGASAGASISHRFLMQYPDRVKKALLYEPAFFTLLADVDEEKRKFIERIHDYIARNKLNGAMFEFIQCIGEQDSRAPEKSEEQSVREMNNLYLFLQKEYDDFVEYRPDMDKSRELADKMLIAVGDGSKGAMMATAAKMFAKCIEKEPIYFPGLHNAPCDLPKEFAICVLGTLMAFD